MQKPADIKEFAEIITERVKTHMTANGIIYDHIYHTNDLSHYEGMKYDPDCEYIVFEYSISDDDKNVSAFACNNTYEQFNNPVINTDEELEKCFDQMTLNLVEAYTNAFYSTLKQFKAEDKLANNIQNLDYVLSHTAVYLVRDDDDPDGEIVKRPFNTDRNLNYALFVGDVTENIGLPLLSKLKVMDQIDFDELLNKKLIENDKLLSDPNRFDVSNVAKLIALSSIPDVIPEFVREHMIQTFFDDYPEFKTDMYVVCDTQRKVRASSFLLSRGAMLIMAKKFGAKRKLQIVIPTSCDIIVRNADDNILTQDELNDKLEPILKDFDIKTNTDSYIYDILTGELS